MGHRQFTPYVDLRRLFTSCVIAAHSLSPNVSHFCRASTSAVASRFTIRNDLMHVSNLNVSITFVCLLLCGFRDSWSGDIVITTLSGRQVDTNISANMPNVTASKVVKIKNKTKMRLVR